MLHCSPADWIIPSRLDEEMGCSNCKKHRPAREGFIGLAHYYGTPSQEGLPQIVQGNRWFCTDWCFLDFEHPSQMARA